MPIAIEKVSNLTCKLRNDNILICTPWFVEDMFLFFLQSIINQLFESIFYVTSL